MREPRLEHDTGANDSEPPLQGRTRFLNPEIAASLAILIWGGGSWLGLLLVLVENQATWEMLLLAPAALGIGVGCCLPYLSAGYLRALGTGIGACMGLFGALTLLEIVVLVSAAGEWRDGVFVASMALGTGGTGWLSLLAMRKEWQWANLPTGVRQPVTQTSPAFNSSQDLKTLPTSWSETPMKPHYWMPLAQQASWARLLILLPLGGLMFVGAWVIILESPGGVFIVAHALVGLVAELLLLGLCTALFVGPRYWRAFSAGTSLVIAFYSAGACLLGLLFPYTVQQVAGFMGSGMLPLLLIALGLVLALAIICIGAAVRFMDLEFRPEMMAVVISPPGEELDTNQGWDQARPENRRE